MTETQTNNTVRRIDEEVTSRPGVTAVTGSRGEHEFPLGQARDRPPARLACRPFGFPKKLWHDSFDAGRITYHPVFPGRPGFAARAIESVRRRRAT